VLTQVAQLLYRTARSTDIVARYGGEEFALVLPNTDGEGARQLAERCRTALAETAFPHRDVTASFGIATLAGSLTPLDELISRADAALYTAKRQGRNRVICAE
jgi:diguanylate cyclase (GGDEF)-like protein